METDETILITGRIVAEFEDDASQFLSGKAEFVGAPEAAVKPAPAPVPPANSVTQGTPDRDTEPRA